MTKQEIKEKLDHSLEVSTIRQWIKIEIGMVLFVCAQHLFGRFLNRSRYEDMSFWAFFVFIAGIVLIPMFAVHAWELRRIYRKYEACKFYQVKLTQPHGSLWRSMHFTVLLRDEDGTIITRTHSIFGTSKYQWGPSMEDYLNKTVTVAYNEETGEVTVIG